jgi:exoribonuclease R
VRRIAGDHFDLDPLGTALVGEHTGRRIRIGDPVSVRVVSIQALRGRVDLEPAEASERAEPPPRRDRAGRRVRGAR